MIYDIIDLYQLWGFRFKYAWGYTDRITVSNLSIGGWKSVFTHPVTTCVTPTGCACNAGRQGNNRIVQSLTRHISDELPQRRTNWEREIRQGSHVWIYRYILCLTSLSLASFCPPGLLFWKANVYPVEHLLLIQMLSSHWWVGLETYNKSGWGVGV